MNGIAEAPAIGIGRLLTDSRFVVPNHQRDYSWTTDEVEQLFDDVEAALDRADPVYFLGFMVFLASRDNSYLTVLDGQQRLATVIILLSAIRSWLQQYGEFQEDAQKIQEWFIGRSELGEKKPQPRLTMNIAKHDMFDRYVVSPVALADISAATNKLARQDRNRPMLEAAVYAHDRVRRIGATAATPDIAAKRLFRLVNYVRDSAAVVKLTVSGEEAAYTIFETLNDRGMDLSPLDLVKNHLFSRADMKGARHVVEMEGRWMQMMSTLSNVKADNFLKAFWTSRHGRIRTTNLFNQFKRRFADVDPAIEVSVDMLAASEQYAALESADDPTWAPFPEEARQSVRALKLLGGLQVHPPILSALSTLDVRETARLLRLFEVIVVRYLVVGGGNTGRLETTCAVLARRIYNREITTATQALGELKELYLPDAEFKQAFAKKQERSPQKVQYFLKALEREQRRQNLGNMADEVQPGALTVEHILPKNPGVEWVEVLEQDPGFHDECLFRIGNQCLLTKVNREIGRLGFIEKKRIYQQSQLYTTKELAEHDTWNRRAVERRQHRLAKLAASAWRFA